MGVHIDKCIIIMHAYIHCYFSHTVSKGKDSDSVEDVSVVLHSPVASPQAKVALISMCRAGLIQTILPEVLW